MPQLPSTANHSPSTPSLLFDVDMDTDNINDHQKRQTGPTRINQPEQEVEMPSSRRPSSSRPRYEVPVLSAEAYALDEFDEEDGQGQGYGHGRSSKHGPNTNQDYPHAAEEEDHASASASAPLLFNGFSSPRDRERPAGYNDDRGGGGGGGGGGDDRDAFRYLLPEGEGAKSTLMAGIANVSSRAGVSALGDTIPHVIASIFPSFKTTPVLWLLVNRKFVVFLATVFVAYPLSLYRDIGKLSRASSMGELQVALGRKNDSNGGHTGRDVLKRFPAV
ncbi:hypothetical protein QFC21_000952 [Naganishia friedmannii]|uniref:Uncharacterized protein n=1 Tax=Naganishia friedmannii TaxID=89922 RepID=A0ACC2W781_9TREE|nr:hypothetical protein QFC21_000952 [Naganishia friedmannii]